ncbi:unnamed protein product [Prorocentrum cordatum]|uniref:Uncharacterized protein n=1 Tax=Prorocentrum cordatum TaxID=2364126 RepID=A0ABN9WYQ9_9DINO|nr:unnamed protein product [Polarella glacialis]
MFAEPASQQAHHMKDWHTSWRPTEVSASHVVLMRPTGVAAHLTEDKVHEDCALVFSIAGCLPVVCTVIRFVSGQVLPHIESEGRLEHHSTEFSARISWVGARTSRFLRLGHVLVTSC